MYIGPTNTKMNMWKAYFSLGEELCNELKRNVQFG